MPECVRCVMLQDGDCSAYRRALEVMKRGLPPPPPGGCPYAIVEGYLPLIQKGSDVLEIGCGAWSSVRVHCKRVGARYEGIDVSPTYFGQPVQATRIEGIQDLSFQDESFDLVIGTQTMEHWARNGCPLSWGLRQCFRVCRTGGRVMLNVPIHFHGSSPFLLGDMEAIRRLFRPFSENVCMETWGNPSAPLPPYYAYRHYWKLRGKPAYHLDIQAVKDKPLPSSERPGLMLSGIPAQMRYYPASFNLYRALQRLGMLREPVED